MCTATPEAGAGDKCDSPGSGLGLVTDVTLQVLSSQVSRMHGRVKGDGRQ